MASSKPKKTAPKRRPVVVEDRRLEQRVAELDLEHRVAALEALTRKMVVEGIATRIDAEIVSDGLRATGKLLDAAEKECADLSAKLDAARRECDEARSALPVINEDWISREKHAQILAERDDALARHVEGLRAASAECDRLAATVRGLEAERDGLRKERDSSRATTEAVMAERDEAREELAQANMRLMSWPANTLALDEIKRIATAAIPVNVAPDTDNALGAVQHLIAFNEKGIRQCGEALEPHVGSDFPTVLDGIAELIKLHQVNARTVATANRALDDLGVPQCEGLLARIHWLWDRAKAGTSDLRRMLDYLMHEHEVASATNHPWRSGRLDALYRAARHCETLIHGDTIVVEEPVAESGLAIEEPRKP